MTSTTQADVAELIEKLRQRGPNGGLFCECGDKAADTLAALSARLAEVEAEVEEQCRLNGMGQERELALMGKLAEVEAENSRLREALEGYQAATSYIAADSWDGCSDCIEILRAARSVDDKPDWSPDDIAMALKRLRARAAIAGKAPE